MTQQFDVKKKAHELLTLVKSKPDYKGGLLLFVATVGEEGYGLGICEKDQSGYWPLSGMLDAKEAPRPESWKDALELQDILNKEIGFEGKRAAEIILSTMRGKGLGPRAETKRRERNKKRAAAAKLKRGGK